MTGMVLSVDPPSQTMVVSCERVPGYMEAMAMRFSVRDAGALNGLKRGTAVEFTFVADGGSSYAERIRIRQYENFEAEPLDASRLKLLSGLVQPDAPASAVLAVGRPVPDFTFMDQSRRRVTLSQFAGKVVAVTFTYIRCPNPSYCFRLATNFRQLQKRFADRMGRDLVLLTIGIDPQHDSGRALADYARLWTSDPQAWRFLTGPPPEIARVSGAFGVDFWGDEGLLIHSFHTAVIDRRQRLAANLEGNAFTADQLGDLVQTVLNRP